MKELEYHLVKRLTQHLIGTEAREEPMDIQGIGNP